MNIAVRSVPSELSGEAAIEKAMPRIERLHICHDLAAAEPFWSKLVASRALATPYQSFAWVSTWHQQVSGPAGMKPLIVIGLDHYGSPLFLLPFVTYQKWSLTVASFFGEDHSNANIGIWRRDILADLTAADCHKILADVAAARRIDLFALRNQPLQWSGRPNPFALLPYQPAPDDLFALEFNGAGGEQVLKHCMKASMRGRLRTKERKLQQLAGYRYARASNAADVDRYLDTFFRQKAAHFRVQGINNVFADPAIEAFLRAACHDGLIEGHPTIQLHALECDAEVLTVFGGVSDGKRFSCMFNSYTISENGRWSPGLIILTHVVAYCADAKLQSFDLGIGHAHYKTFFCKQSEPLFNSFVAGSARGGAAAMAMSALYRAKQRIKSSAMLRSAMAALRRRISGSVD
jgi:CelD/BcsL family acetyltransferase involved in cellulose biosynthesis